jgi:hypothetical protein
MTKVLVLVHGMGEHAKGWSRDIVAKLDEVASRYPAFQSQTPFSQRVDRIEEIQYDDVFADVAAGWAQDASALDAWSKQQQRPLPKLVSWLRKPLPSAAKGFFWTTAIDPLLYRGFRLVRDNVRAQVTAQMAAIADRAMTNGAAEISILSHSLGTAVMHDALDILGRAPYEGNEVLTAKRFQFANLFMLADVCLLARNLLADIDYFDSVVRPTSAGTADNTYCQFFLNAWHRYDPFVALAPFRPTSWGDAYVELGPLEHWRQANVHGFTHYLDNPIVHAPIINGALGKPAITDADQARELAKYPMLPPGGCAAEIAALKLKGQEVAHAADLEEIIIGIAEFLAASQQAAQACNGLVSKDMFV